MDGAVSLSLGVRVETDLHLAKDLMPDTHDPFLTRSLQALQENIRRSGPAATASYTLIGAIVFAGGVGYLVDDWLGTSPWLLLACLMVGLFTGFYELAKTVWKP